MTEDGQPVDEYVMRCRIARLLKDYETNKSTYAEFENEIIKLIKLKLIKNHEEVV